MAKKGYDADFADAIFKQICGFGEYGFPESHAYSFALLAYISLWMKCHEPAIFLAALINSQPMGFYAPAQLVQDAVRHGVEVRPVDVCESDWDCSLERRSDGGAHPAVVGQPGHQLAGLSLSASAGREQRAQPIERRRPEQTTPDAISRCTESARLMRARTPRTRSITAAKSTRISARISRAIRSTSRISAYRCGVRMIAFDGTQPPFRQSPPSRSRSISATFAPSAAAPLALVRILRGSRVEVVALGAATRAPPRLVGRSASAFSTRCRPRRGPRRT